MKTEKLRAGSHIVFDSPKLHGTYVVTHLETLRNDEVIVHSVPKDTPVANSTMFLLDLFNDYKIIKF